MKTKTTLTVCAVLAFIFTLFPAWRLVAVRMPEITFAAIWHTFPAVNSNQVPYTSVAIAWDVMFVVYLAIGIGGFLFHSLAPKVAQGMSQAREKSKGFQIPQVISGTPAQGKELAIVTAIVCVLAIIAVCASIGFRWEVFK